SLGALAQPQFRAAWRSCARCWRYCSALLELARPAAARGLGRRPLAADPRHIQRGVIALDPADGDHTRHAPLFETDERALRNIGAGGALVAGVELRGWQFRSRCGHVVPSRNTNASDQATHGLTRQSGPFFSI